jgi:DNA-binding response OmpR family regulator
MGKEGQKILVVDDDPDIGIMLKLMLEYKGYDAVVATSAERAEEIIEHESVKLVIMDMLLSGSNGTDLCEKLRKEENTKHLPILMISAHPNAEEICIAAGANDFILKPFDMQEILSRVHQLLVVNA